VITHFSQGTIIMAAVVNGSPELLKGIIRSFAQNAGPYLHLHSGPKNFLELCKASIPLKTAPLQNSAHVHNLCTKRYERATHQPCISLFEDILYFQHAITYPLYV
jgi:hypothetical protein